MANAEIDSYDHNSDDVYDLVPMNKYDFEEGKLQSSIYWLIARAFAGSEIPKDFQEPFYSSDEHKHVLVPAVLYALCNGELYGMVASQLFRDDHFRQSLGHSPLLQSLSRHGIHVTDHDSKPVTETMLSNTSPVRVTAHLALIDGLMVAAFRVIVNYDRLFLAIRKHASIGPTDGALNLEDALLLWINKICSALRDKIEQEAGPDSEPPIIPEMEDLYEDLSDFCCIAAVVSFYHPDKLKLEDIALADSIGFADAIHNIQLVERFCDQCLPCSTFHTSYEDIVYMHEIFKPNILIFLAELFYWLELATGPSAGHMFVPVPDAAEPVTTVPLIASVPQSHSTPTTQLITSPHSNSHVPNSAVIPNLRRQQLQQQQPGSRHPATHGRPGPVMSGATSLMNSVDSLVTNRSVDSLRYQTLPHQLQSRAGGRGVAAGVGRSTSINDDRRDPIGHPQQSLGAPLIDGSTTFRKSPTTSFAEMGRQSGSAASSPQQHNLPRVANGGQSFEIAPPYPGADGSNPGMTVAQLQMQEKRRVIEAKKRDLNDELAKHREMRGKEAFFQALGKPASSSMSPSRNTVSNLAGEANRGDQYPSGPSQQMVMMSQSMFAQSSGDSGAQQHNAFQAEFERLQMAENARQQDAAAQQQMLNFQQQQTMMFRPLQSQVSDGHHYMSQPHLMQQHPGLFTAGASNMVYAQPHAAPAVPVGFRLHDGGGGGIPNEQTNGHHGYHAAPQPMQYEAPMNQSQAPMQMMAQPPAPSGFSLHGPASQPQPQLPMSAKQMGSQISPSFRHPQSQRQQSSPQRSPAAVAAGGQPPVGLSRAFNQTFAVRQPANRQEVLSVASPSEMITASGQPQLETHSLVNSQNGTPQQESTSAPSQSTPSKGGIAMEIILDENDRMHVSSPGQKKTGGFGSLPRNLAARHQLLQQQKLADGKSRESQQQPIARFPEIGSAAHSPDHNRMLEAPSEREASPAVGFVTEPVLNDAEREEEMEKRKHQILENALRRRELNEQKRTKVEDEQRKRQEVDQRRAEMQEKKKGEQEMRRKKAWENYQIRKREEDALENPLATSSASPGSSSAGSLRSKQPRGHSQPPLVRPKSQAMPDRAASRTNKMSSSTLVMGDGGFPPDPQDYTDSRTYSDHGSGTPVEQSSLKLFVKPSQKSNRSLVYNALQYSVLAGPVNEDTKRKVFDELAKSDSKHFLVLFRDNKCQFRGLYSWDQVSDNVAKLYGTGPKTCTEAMIDRMFKYDSGGKHFNPIPAKHLSATIDGFAIQDHFWQKKKQSFSGVTPKR